VPTPSTILSNLALIAKNAWPLAVAWHVLAAAAFVGLARGWRLSRRAAGALLTAPIASAAAAALAHRNPFNGAILGVLAVALAALAMRLPTVSVTRAGRLATIAGAVMIAFGWVYPHFLEGHTAAMYLVAAPLGLLPCPTLSFTVGLALLGGGFGGRAWTRTLAGAGLFYGVFGVLRLGVVMDGVLIAGAAALLTLSFSRRAILASVPA